MPARFAVLSIVCSSLCLIGSAQDSIRAVATSKYEHPSLGEKLLIGSNYRKLWSMPVSAKVLHMDRELGGLSIAGRGGGMQTLSLHLKDKQGGKWALRSVDKTVGKAMDAEGIRNGTIRNMAQQMLSAANPYGSLTVPPMAKALGVVSAASSLVWVPDDPLLGKYRGQFANTLCILEQRDPVLFSGDKIESTDQLRKDLARGKSIQLDEKMLLQARLLDMLIGDWDRHDEQWKWEYHKQESSTIVYPIPKDHDQAFFNSDGLVIAVARPIRLQMMVGFRKNLKLNSLNYKSWGFDASLMKDLKDTDWREGIARFQARLTDQVLAEACRRLPPEVYRDFGAELFTLLSARRDNMGEAAMDYYHFLQTHPEKVRDQGEKASKRKESLEAAKH